ncbi:MAG: hypothetical protein Q9228_006526, partial [Teloschistes exilis]
FDFYTSHLHHPAKRQKPTKYLVIFDPVSAREALKASEAVREKHFSIRTITHGHTPLKYANNPQLLRALGFKPVFSIGDILLPIYRAVRLQIPICSIVVLESLRFDEFVSTLVIQLCLFLGGRPSE